MSVSAHESLDIGMFIYFFSTNAVILRRIAVRVRERPSRGSSALHARDGS